MKFKFQDCMLVKVDRAKPGELVIKFSVKEEDYQMSDYIYLRALCKDGGDGINELDFTTFKAKIKKNPPQVVIDAEEQVPEEYIVTKEVKTISKTAIKVALQSGKEVKGCRLEQGERLSIS